MNRHDSERFCTESLESAAKRYKILGFSTIPLHGARNPQQPKLPAIKWARFQHTQPSDEELQTWFRDQHDRGIGIVCGRISRLMVLDFDNASVVSEFRHQYPQLLNTFTVQSGTRGLPHFYYRLPAGRLVTTSAYPGVDLRGEGAYVVAAPTHVGNAKWIVINEADIHAISEFELRLVMRFLAGLKPIEVQAVESIIDVQNPAVSEFRHPCSETDLIDHYRQMCVLGRNQALFKTAVIARDGGISEALCRFMLASIHGREPGTERENYQTRYEEALRTIASAYKRSPRQKTDKGVTGLGNAVREWLLANGLAALSRVLDGMYLSGMKSDDCFTEREACQKLAHLKIGRRSIMNALKAVVEDCPAFEVVDTPPYPPVDANAAIGSNYLNNSCEMSRGAKRVKIVKRGRPARLYRLPSPVQLSERIGIKIRTGDVVHKEDFVNSRTYRQALHKQLLERRPGHYARAWLGERLGVSRWTTRRYEKAAQLYVKPTYAIQDLSWSNAAKLPQSVTDLSRGVFLEDGNGKRYPAIKGLALKLLKRGYELVLKQQQANFYASIPLGVGIPTPCLQPSSVTIHSSQSDYPKDLSRRNNTDTGTSAAPMRADIESTQATGKPSAIGVGIPTLTYHESVFWFCPECLDFHISINRPDSCTRCGRDSDWEIIPSSIWRDAQALKHWWQNRYRDHQQTKREHTLEVIQSTETMMTPQARALVEKVHHEIPHLSLSNARKLVCEFSEHLVEKALLAVHARRGLRSPAGFLIAFLRSEYKLFINNKNEHERSVNPKGESAAEWVRRLAKSQYLSFIANADDILNFGLSHDPTPA